jgi:hypothetical protein
MALLFLAAALASAIADANVEAFHAAKHKLVNDDLMHQVFMGLLPLVAEVKKSLAVRRSSSARYLSDASCFMTPDNKCVPNGASWKEVIGDVAKDCGLYLSTMENILESCELIKSPSSCDGTSGCTWSKGEGFLPYNPNPSIESCSLVTIYTCKSDLLVSNALSLDHQYKLWCGATKFELFAQCNDAGDEEEIHRCVMDKCPLETALIEFVAINSACQSDDTCTDTENCSLNPDGICLPLEGSAGFVKLLKKAILAGTPDSCAVKDLIVTELEKDCEGRYDMLSCVTAGCKWKTKKECLGGYDATGTLITSVRQNNECRSDYDGFSGDGLTAFLELKSVRLQQQTIECGKATDFETCINTKQVNAMTSYSTLQEETSNSVSYVETRSGEPSGMIQTISSRFNTRFRGTVINLAPSTDEADMSGVLYVLNGSNCTSVLSETNHFNLSPRILNLLPYYEMGSGFSIPGAPFVKTSDGTAQIDIRAAGIVSPPWGTWNRGEPFLIVMATENIDQTTAWVEACAVVNEECTGFQEPPQCEEITEVYYTRAGSVFQDNPLTNNLNQQGPQKCTEGALYRWQPSELRRSLSPIESIKQQEYFDNHVRGPVEVNGETLYQCDSLLPYACDEDYIEYSGETSYETDSGVVTSSFDVIITDPGKDYTAYASSLNGNPQGSTNLLQINVNCGTDETLLFNFYEPLENYSQTCYRSIPVAVGETNACGEVLEELAGKEASCRVPLSERTPKKLKRIEFELFDFDLDGEEKAGERVCVSDKNLDISASSLMDTPYVKVTMDKGRDCYGHNSEHNSYWFAALKRGWVCDNPYDKNNLNTVSVLKEFSQCNIDYQKSENCNPDGKLWGQQYCENGGIDYTYSVDQGFTNTNIKWPIEQNPFATASPNNEPCSATSCTTFSATQVASQCSSCMDPECTGGQFVGEACSDDREGCKPEPAIILENGIQNTCGLNQKWGKFYPQNQTLKKVSVVFTDVESVAIHVESFANAKTEPDQDAYPTAGWDVVCGLKSQKCNAIDIPSPIPDFFVPPSPTCSTILESEADVASGGWPIEEKTYPLGQKKTGRNFLIGGEIFAVTTIQYCQFPNGTQINYSKNTEL